MLSPSAGSCRYKAMVCHSPSDTPSWIFVWTVFESPSPMTSTLTCPSFSLISKDDP